MRILLIEDNQKMSRFIRQGLIEQGHAVDVAENGHEGEEIACSQPYDLVILDIMLPDQDGVATCRNMRRRGVKSPVLMLTALSTTGDKVQGLDAGADDYLTKPFEFDELVARIRALLRRGSAQEASVLKFEDLELDLLKRSVTRGGQKIKLTTKEFALLEYFMRHPDRVLTRTAIGEHVWDMNFDGDSNVIDVYVSMLRRKIDKGFSKRLLHTIVGTGYKMSVDEAAE
ncbi:MAG TPA: response regulator transcription factor [Phycisphaerae bacterium]|nr:response regulator transcription factor [Phycisphaerae bacterium]